MNTPALAPMTPDLDANGGDRRVHERNGDLQQPQMHKTTPHKHNIGPDIDVKRTGADVVVGVLDPVFIGKLL